MSKVKPILRELRQAALKAGLHSKDKLPQLTRNMNDHLDGVVKKVKKNDKFDSNVDVNMKKFKKNKDHDSTEYNDQYNEQMDTLQGMSAADWLRNRIEYLDKGRTSDSLRAQQATRDAAYDNHLNELLDADPNLSYDDAAALAAKWLKTQAALHRLDGVAGGNQTDVPRVGDTRINSSLGSQWSSRVGDIDNAIIDFVNKNPGVDLNNVGINVSFR